MSITMTPGWYALRLTALLACVLVRAHALAAEEPLTRQEIRYEISGAAEVQLVWGVDGWQPLPEALRPSGTTTTDGLMHTPMRPSADGLVAAELRVPSGARIDFGFLIARLSNGARAGIWDGRGSREDDYHARAGETNPVVVMAAPFVQRKAAKLLSRPPSPTRTVPSDAQATHWPIVPWLVEELGKYGITLVVLVALATCSSQIRRAVTGGRLGETIAGQPMPPAMLWAIGLFPVWFWLWSVWSSLALETLFLQTVVEDGWMEYGQTALLSLSWVTSGLIARSLWKTNRRIWAWAYLLLALALFWVMGEEISWGQRLLHLPTPAWFRLHNMQQEMNLHNLPELDDNLNIWTDAVLAGMVLVSAAVWMTGLNRLRRVHAALWVPHPSLIPALCCVLSYGETFRLYELLHPEEQSVSDAVAQLQEPRELILYFSLVVFLLLARQGYHASFGARSRPHGPQTACGLHAA